ncbi:MAG: UDP-2,3-diacylglucosamine diphosphatase [Deltaproteobacteria bacterium]|nr:UDP-2,3-diacylglucosamine diphosphatase [Deltaproteobacteria bacterium]
MKAVFIADAHLDGSTSDGYRYLMRFLSSIQGSVDELFILGDFFDFWFAGKNGVYPGFSDIVERLLEMQGAGTNVSFFEGNHDFFLSDYFEPYGIRVFSEGAIIDLDGKRLFLSHGDTVDTSNKAYLSFRRLLRSGLIYRIQKRLPSPVLWSLSRVISGMSRNREAPQSNGLDGRINMFATDKFEEGADAVILGHFHSPRFEQHVIRDRVKTFAILGDWMHHHSYLLYDDGEFLMKSGIPSD